MAEVSKTVACRMDVHYIANLARLQLTDAEANEFQAQLIRIVEHFNELRDLDLGDIEPMAHAISLENVFREDVSRPGLDHSSVMANAPQQCTDLFVVPKIVE